LPKYFTGVSNAWEEIHITAEEIRDHGEALRAAGLEE
jgi:hypothetical protein